MRPSRPCLWPGLPLVGAVALRGLQPHQHQPLTATASGSGIALVVDELALLIDLQDVCWAAPPTD